MQKVCIWITAIIAALLIVFGACCLNAYIFMLLWNWIMPLFGVITLTFWQSLGLSFLLSFVGGKFYNINQASENLKRKFKTLKDEVDKQGTTQESLEKVNEDKSFTIPTTSEEPLTSEETNKEEEVSTTSEVKQKKNKPRRKRKNRDNKENKENKEEIRNQE